MTEIKFDYRGYEIRYSPNADEFVCWDLKLEAPTIGKLQAKIDKVLLTVRKENAVKCFVVGSFHELREGTITEFLSESDIIEWQRHARVKTGTDYKVAVMMLRDGRDKPGRSTEKLSDCVRHDADVESYRALVSDAKEIIRQQEKRMSVAKAALPRLTVEDIAELRRIATTTEGSAA